MAVLSLDTFQALKSLSATALLAASLGSSILCYCLYNYCMSPLAGLPGPLSAKLGFDSWILTRAVKRDALWQLKKLHNKYVGIVPPVLRAETFKAEWRTGPRGADSSKPSLYRGSRINQCHIQIVRFLHAAGEWKG